MPFHTEGSDLGGVRVRCENPLNQPSFRRPSSALSTTLECPFDGVRVPFRRGQSVLSTEEGGVGQLGRLGRTAIAQRRVSTAVTKSPLVAM